MNEIGQLKKLMEAMSEGGTDRPDSGMQDTSRMVFDHNESVEEVLREVSGALAAVGYQIKLIDEEGLLYARIKKVK